MDSDRSIRKRGMGSIQKRGKRFITQYRKNKKRIQKTFDTPEQCEEWLKKELNLQL